MKTLPIALFGGFVTSVCLAAPHGALDDGRLIITGIQAPLATQRANSASSPDVELHTQVEVPAPQSVTIAPKAPYRASHIYSEGRSGNDSALPLSTLTPKVQPPKEEKVLLPTTFFVRRGEPPYRALIRWLHAHDLHQVALSFDEAQRSILMQSASEPMNFTGTLPESVVELGERLEVPLAFEVRGGITAIHTLDSEVDIVWVKGDSLKAAVARLAKDYQWYWREGNIQPSWRSDNDYPLMSEFGLVTPQGAFDVALDTLLQGYPVQAKLIPSSRTLFIQERD